MKPLLGLLVGVTLASRAYAIVDPTIQYKNIEKRILEIKDSREQISNALISVHLAKDERKQLEDWRKSLSEEEKILAERLELFKKLQQSGVITYISDQNKEMDRKTDTKPSPTKSSP